MRYYAYVQQYIVIGNSWMRHGIGYHVVSSVCCCQVTIMQWHLRSLNCGKKRDLQADTHVCMHEKSKIPVTTLSSGPYDLSPAVCFESMLSR